MTDKIVTRRVLILHRQLYRIVIVRRILFARIHVKGSAGRSAEFDSSQSHSAFPKRFGVVDGDLVCMNLFNQGSQKTRKTCNCH